MQRYLENELKNHLQALRQMIFLMGPRQVGKTTLAQTLLKEIIPGTNYFSWDNRGHRKILLKNIFIGREVLKNQGQDIVVFDEIHKYHRWKNAIKGLFDTNEPHTHWIVTGSGLLNVYRRGQDSLMGRYFSYHLCPLSVAELSQKKHNCSSLSKILKIEFDPPQKNHQDILENLLAMSGFPEPFLKNQNSFLTRWRTSRLDRLLNQDLAQTENLRNLSLVENLMMLLPERVGSLLSLNALREDLEVHHHTVRHWLQLLERVYYGFFIKPYSVKKTRLIKKEAKWYLWDWTEIEDPGVRFENLVAVHLLKYIFYQNELGLDDLSLHFVRDKEKREIDFLICQKNKPMLAIECKLKSDAPTSALYDYAEKFNIPRALQVTKENNRIRTIQKNKIKIDVIPAASFLKELI